MAKIKTATAPKEGSKKTIAHVVVTEFRDNDNFAHVHTVGTDVSHFDKSRLDHLVSIGLVEATENDE